MLEVGFGQADITPPVGVPLGGFIARENRPSSGIDTALFVRALALRQQEDHYLLLSYDLLGLDADLEAQILTRLESDLAPQFTRERCVLAAVHNHSGPATGILLGEKTPGLEYFQDLAGQSARAASQAFADLCPAKLYTAERRLNGLTYNRRALLSDGRVSISPVPDLPVVQRGPLDDRMTLLLWRDLTGHPIAGLIHYACHGVAVLSQAIGGDIPGELAARIGEQVGAPFLFLQGAAGDTNPTTVTTERADLLEWTGRAMELLRGLEDSFQPAVEQPLRMLTRCLSLQFAPLPDMVTASKKLHDLERIAAGEANSPDLQETVQSFKNTMNLSPDQPLDPAKARFTALALVESARRTLSAAQSGKGPAPLPLSIKALQTGEFALVFIAGEVFASTGLRIRALSDQLSILPISYLSPLVGYLPDAGSIRLGGYEVSDAWRFYGHAAPFAEDSEECIVDEVAQMVEELGRGD